MLLPFGLLGAILGLGVVSFPQAMISRPIVAATLGGALAGDPAAGLTTGAALEMLALETLPIGAARYPEWGTASVVGGALYAWHAGDAGGALLIAVLFAICIAWVGGWSMYALRRLNGVWTKRFQPALEAGSADAVIGLQLRGLTADLVRGGALTMLALLAGRPLQHALLARWALAPEGSRFVLVLLALAVAASAVWKLAHGATGARWFFLGGLAVGFALFVVLVP